jgi:hypothetical protein
MVASRDEERWLHGGGRLPYGLGGSAGKAGRGLDALIGRHAGALLDETGLRLQQRRDVARGGGVGGGEDAGDGRLAEGETAAGGRQGAAQESSGSRGQRQ